ncbi:MAG: redoxin domain-containing protein [Alistipes sp.]|nr:redoxin domain-containing protein [Alistipes sp.]
MEAQKKLIVGVKAPDLKVSQWLSTSRPDDNLPTWIEFFFSRSKSCTQRLETLDQWAQRYAGRLNVMVLSCESQQTMDSLFTAQPYAFLFGCDPEKKNFTAYDAQFVPYGVLLDAKKRVVWFGNPTKFDTQWLQKTIDRRP